MSFKKQNKVIWCQEMELSKFKYILKKKEQK